MAGDFNAYTEVEPDYIKHDGSFDILDNLGYIEDSETPLRSNQDKHEVNAYGRNLLNLCINTGMRIMNGRYESDAGVGSHTFIYI